MRKTLLVLTLCATLLATALPATAATNYTGTINRIYISNTTLWVKLTTESGNTSLYRVNANLDATKLLLATLLTAVSLSKEVIMTEDGGVWTNKAYLLP